MTLITTTINNRRKRLKLTDIESVFRNSDIFKGLMMLEEHSIFRWFFGVYGRGGIGCYGRVKDRSLLHKKLTKYL